MNIRDLSPPDKYLISQTRLAQAFDMSIDALRKRIKSDPSAPQPIKLGTTRQAPVFYLLKDVETWIQSKLNKKGSDFE